MDKTKVEKNQGRTRTRPLSDSLDHWIAAKIPLRYNILSHQNEICDAKAAEWREIRDEDSVSTSFNYQRSTGSKVSSARVHETLLMLAKAYPYDPLKQHILGLPEWDGEHRVDTWLVDSIGAADTAYTRLVSRKWLIAAIARALNPGCKVDNVLILHGEQGEGKSTLFRDLATDEFFNEEDFDFSNTQKSGLALRGTWIHEWAELDNMSRATHTRLKSFISERFSRFRPPYGRAMVSEPRRCVFAGSSNKDDFLTDSTGNRRFWPVKVGQYDQNAFLAMREQLLAEALVAFQAKETHWLSREEEILAARPRELVEHEDAWTRRILPALKGQEKVNILDLLEDTLLLSTERIEIKHQSRVAGILRKAGWRQGPKVDGCRLWSPKESVT